MRWYTQQEFDKANKELGFQVLLTGYLCLDYCEDCGWPVVWSRHSPGKPRICEHCRESNKEMRQERAKALRRQRSTSAATVPQKSPEVLPS